jgi:hypothetical protein
MSFLVPGMIEENRGMKRQLDAERQQIVKESLLSANAGCLLAMTIVLGLPFAGAGGFFVVLGLSSMRNQARLQETAVIVPAIIVSSEVRRSTANPDGTSTPCWADIEFTYEFEGTVRSSDKVWPIAEGSSSADVQRVVDRYPQGARVSAFRDSSDPGIAFLEKRWSQMPYVSVSIGCLPAVFLTALCTLIAGWKRPRIALLSGLCVAVVVIIMLFLTGEHYLRHVPEGDRRWWIWMMLAGSGALALGQFATVIKAKQLNRQYREALEAV